MSAPAPLLVTGAAGYLGARLLRRAAGRRPLAAAYFQTPPQPFPGVRAVPLDLTDAAAVRAVVAQLRPAAIIHTACSNRSDAHIAAIVPAARHLAQAAREVGARLVHVSTDMVFDGEHAPYSDDAPPAPLTPYARAKAEAEALVAEHVPAALIVRPSLIWGLDPIDRQTQWLVEGARRGERVTLFTDEVRCPVHVDDLAEALLALAEQPALSGPLNLGGPQALNRWAFGLRLLAALGLPRPPNVVPGTVAEAGLCRPRDLTLLTARAAGVLARPLRGVDEVMAALRAAARRPRYCEG